MGWVAATSNIIFFHQSGSRMFRSFFAGHQAETREEGLLFQSLVYYRSPSSITEPGSYLGIHGHSSPRQPIQRARTAFSISYREPHMLQLKLTMYCAHVLLLYHHHNGTYCCTLQMLYSVRCFLLCHDDVSVIITCICNCSVL